MKINASVLYLASLATAKILQDVAQVGHHIAERAEVAKLDEKCPHCKTVTITSNTAICYPTSPLLPPPSSTCESDISGAGGAATAGSGGSGGSANGLPSGPGNSLSSGFGATPAGSLSGQQTPSISGIGGPSGTGGGPGSPSISGLPGQGNGAGGSSGGPGSPTNSGLNPPGGVSSPGASASGGGAGGAGGSPGVSPGPSGSNGAGGGGGPASPSPTPSGGSGSTGLPPRLKFLIAFSQPLNPGARSTSGFASRNGSQDDCKTSTGYQLNSDGILSVYNRDDLVYSATTGVASAVFTPSTSPGDITTFWGINNGTLEWRNAEFLGNLAVFCTFPTSDDITTYFTVAPPSECTRVYLTAEPAAACPGYIGDPESQTELGPQASSGGASVPATPIITSPSGPSGEPSAGASISDNGPPASGSDNGAPGPSESPSASVPGAGESSAGSGPTASVPGAGASTAEGGPSASVSGAGASDAGSSPSPSASEVGGGAGAGPSDSGAGSIPSPSISGAAASGAGNGASASGSGAGAGPGPSASDSAAGASGAGSGPSASDAGSGPSASGGGSGASASGGGSGPSPSASGNGNTPSSSPNGGASGSGGASSSPGASNGGSGASPSPSPSSGPSGGAASSPSNSGSAGGASSSPTGSPSAGAGGSSSPGASASGGGSSGGSSPSPSGASSTPSGNAGGSASSSSVSSTSGGAASPGVSGSSTSGSSTASTASSASATPTFSTNYTCDLGTAFNQFYNGTGKRLPINNPAAWDSNIYPRITQTIDASQTFCQARTSCENAAVTNSYLTYEVAFDYSVPAWQCAIYHSTLNDSSYVTDLSSNYGHGEAYYGLPNCTVRNFKQFYQGFGTRLVDNNPGNDNYAVWPSPLSFDYPLESYDNCSFVTECRRRTRFYNYHMFDITADYSTHTWRCLLWHNQLNASNYQPWTQSTGFKNSPGRFYSFPVTDPSVCNSRFSLLNNGTGLRLLDSNPANDQPGTYPPLNSVITAATANNNPCTAIDLCSQVGQNQCPPYHTLYLNVLSNGNFNCTVYHGDLTSTGGGSYFTADSSIGQFYTYHNSTYPDNYPVCP